MCRSCVRVRTQRHDWQNYHQEFQPVIHCQTYSYRLIQCVSATAVTHGISISCSAHWGVPVWYFSGRKCRYDLYPYRELPTWHNVSYHPTSSTGKCTYGSELVMREIVGGICCMSTSSVDSDPQTWMLTAKSATVSHVDCSLATR